MRITYDVCIGQRPRAASNGYKPWHVYMHENHDGVAMRSFALYLYGLPVFSDTPDNFETKKEAIAAARVIASIVRTHNTSCGVLIGYKDKMLEVPND